MPKRLTWQRHLAEVVVFPTYNDGEMTLIMTLIRPEGIWQSADNRVTKRGRTVDDAAPKQLHIICPPHEGGPHVLLGYTGLAEMPDGTPTLQWIRETLRGETRSIMGSPRRLVVKWRPERPRSARVCSALIG